MTSEFVFFSSNPSLNHIKIEKKCLLLFTTNTKIFTLLLKELKTDGQSFIFAICLLTNDHVTSNLISLFWKFSILSNILDLQWCLPNKRKIHSQLSAMLTCRNGKGGDLNSQASKMLYKLPGVVYIASYKEPLDQSDCWKFFVQLWNYTKLE